MVFYLIKLDNSAKAETDIHHIFMTITLGTQSFSLESWSHYPWPINTYISMGQ